MVYRLSDPSFPNGFAKFSSMPHFIKQQLKATFFSYRKINGRSLSKDVVSFSDDFRYQWEIFPCACTQSHSKNMCMR